MFWASGYIIMVVWCFIIIYYFIVVAKARTKWGVSEASVHTHMTFIKVVNGESLNAPPWNVKTMHCILVEHINVTLK
jgi:hypothetical protein